MMVLYVRRGFTLNYTNSHRETDQMTASGVRRAKAAFLSGCESHPAMLLQPEAIGAVMEVTKWLKPLV